MVGKCGDGPGGDGGYRLERKRTGQGRLEEVCEGSQNPPRAVMLLLLMMLMMMMTTTTTYKLRSG
jgi:hypothetical protein